MNSRGIIFDLKKYAIHDGPGIRTTVFFKGCPLRCWWCHNPESQDLAAETMVKINPQKCLNLTYYTKSEEIVGREVTADAIMQEIEKDIIFYDQSSGGATFSGGEPLMQPEFLHSLLERCRQKSIHTAVDTTGFATWDTLKPILGKVDLFLYDLKLMDRELHKKYTNVDNHRILENLKKLSEKLANIWIRIPIIPGITDTEENITQIADFVLTLDSIQTVHLLPYNPIGKEKYTKLNKTNNLNNLPAPSKQEMKRLKNRFNSQGIEVKIGG